MFGFLNASFGKMWCASAKPGSVSNPTNATLGQPMGLLLALTYAS